MHTPPVTRLPVDPNPKPARPDSSVDRGFADYLDDAPRQTRTDDRSDTPVRETRETEREHPADTRPERREDAAVRAPDDRPQQEVVSETARTPDDAGAPNDAATGETKTSQNRSDDQNNAPDPQAGSGIALPVMAPVDPTAAPKPAADAAARAPSAEPTVSVTLQEGIAVTANEPNGATLPSGTQEPAAAPADTVGASTAPAVDEPEFNEEASVATPAAGMPAAAPDANETGNAAGDARPAQAAAPVSPAAAAQPAPATERAAIAAQTQAGAAKPVGRTQNGVPAGGTAQAGDPASPSLSDGETAEAVEEGEFRPATATDASDRTKGATQVAVKAETAANAANTAQKGDWQAPTQTGAPAAQDVAAPMAADRGGELPTQTTSGGSSHQTVAAGTATGEARAASGSAAAPDTAGQRPPANAATQQVAIQINRAVQDGQEKITVNLKPATLGKVTVNLELGHDHRVIAVISADRQDTLDLLQRDARTLERALQDAGLKTDSGSLSFNLQGNGSDRSPADDGEPAGRYAAFTHTDDAEDALPVVSNPYAPIANASGVDIHV